jgi:hypothetical protein
MLPLLALLTLQLVLRYRRGRWRRGMGGGGGGGGGGTAAAAALRELFVGTSPASRCNSWTVQTCNFPSRTLVINQLNVETSTINLK